MLNYNIIFAFPLVSYIIDNLTFSRMILPMDQKSKAIHLHEKLRGKIETRSKKAIKNKAILSLAYTPGVAEPVKHIFENPESVYKLTMKGNTVAVVSDGSAVLGLGNVGASAAIPVMEGKCAIFKEFADVDAFPICIETQNVDEIVTIIRNISPIFGGINIEDISAPRCFEIEERLQDLGIPVVHDDQHATAIIVLAALLNAAKVAKKEISQLKIVFSGAGAAADATIRLLAKLKPEDIIVADSKGILSSKRSDINSYKKTLSKITNKNDVSGTLTDAAKNADVLIGLSRKDLFTEEIVRSLSSNSIIFAMANPYPEVLPENAKKWGVKIMGTGRSDYPNQINNSSVFPGFFKGLLHYRISKITDEIKLAAAYAIANLIKKPTAENFIPSMFDKRVVPAIVKSLSKFA